MAEMAAMSSATRRDEFIKRSVAESRSEEYLSLPVEITKSQSHSQLAAAATKNAAAVAMVAADDPIEFKISPPVQMPNIVNVAAANTTTSDVGGDAHKYDESKSEARKETHKGVLKQAYHCLLAAILDPIAHLREKHNFEIKVLTKIVKCDGCQGVLWGIHRQGLQCTKCYLSIHEKCRELVQENCFSSNGSRRNRRSLKLDDSMLQLELVNRYQDIKSNYPNYLNRVREVFACVMNDAFRSDIKQTQQNFMQKSFKQIRTRLKVHVVSASNLLAKDSCGTSDPYVTIQCAFSRIKKTRTRKKNLNPVWNETLEFELVNTADGIISDSGNCGTKMIVRVWDEDQGLKAQLDKMLTNEQDDFLGQVVLDLNDLKLGVEETYRLQPRHDGSHVSGHLVLKFEQKVVETLSNYRQGLNELGSEKSLKMVEAAQRTSYIDEYRCLHRHLFNFLLETCESGGRDEPFSNIIDTTWLLNCFPKNVTEKCFKVNYFKDAELNLMLKHFANKYAISEQHKQIIHLECFYTFFFDSVYYFNLCNLSTPSTRRLYSINCQLLNYTTELVTNVSETNSYLGLYASAADVNDLPASADASPQKKTQNQVVGSFIKKTLALPFKIVLVLSNFRLNFGVRYRMRRGRFELVGGSGVGVGDDVEMSLGETAIDELREMVNFFRAICGLVQTLAARNKANLNRFEQIEAKFVRKYTIAKASFGYDTKDQYELIKQAIERSLISSFNAYLNVATRDDTVNSGAYANSYLHQNMPGEETRRSSAKSNDSSATSPSFTHPKQINRTNSFGRKVEFELDRSTISTPPPPPQIVSVHYLAERIESLIELISKKLPIEIELNEQLYFSAFYVFNEQFNKEFQGGFRQFCSRVLFEQFMLELMQTIKIDLAPRMQIDLIKQHLNLHLLVKRFFNENGLNQSSQKEISFYTADTISEFFQPFLLEYIRLQEDQFIKYAAKIYDVTRINSLASEIARMIEHNRVVLLSMSSIESASATAAASAVSGSSGSPSSSVVTTNGFGSGSACARGGSHGGGLPHELIDKYSIDVKSTKAIYDLENYYSASVTDFFTIMHELLQTLLSFDSTDSQANLPHQMGFVNLIKSKLLAYSAHVKKEFQKMYTEARTQRDLKARILTNLDDESDEIYPSTQLTITSCILMNNFQKTIDFLNEIEPKLTKKSKLNRTVCDQLESIRLILREDLHNMIVEYALEYEQPLLDVCRQFQLKMYADKGNEGKSAAASHHYHITQMKNLIDQSLFNIFNDRFMICKIVLFDLIFKQLLEQIFKLTVKCVESSIILSRDIAGTNAQLSSDFESCSSSSSAEQSPSSSSSYIASLGGSFFNKIGTFFTRTSASRSNGETSNVSEMKEKSLLNDFQYKTIQHYLKHIVEFFSGDEEFIKKDYLINTNEYQSALRTLDLYLNSSNQLIASFVRTQNIQQNNIDFRQCFGKIRIQIEMKQNPKLKTELSLTVHVLEARSVTWSHSPTPSPNLSPIQYNNPTTTYVELYAFGPFQSIRSWPMKIIPATYVEPAKQVVYFGGITSVGDELVSAVATLATQSFEFKIVLSSSEAKRLVEDDQTTAPMSPTSHTSANSGADEKKILDTYEIEIVMKEIVASSGHTNVIGVSVFNLGEAVQAANVWRRLIREEQMRDDMIDSDHFNHQRIKSINLSTVGLYANMDLWLPLRPRLKINDHGYKILKVLEKHAIDKRAIEFIKLKTLSRTTNS